MLCAQFSSKTVDLGRALGDFTAAGVASSDCRRPISSARSFAWRARAFSSLPQVFGWRADTALVPRSRKPYAPIVL